MRKHLMIAVQIGMLVLINLFYTNCGRPEKLPLQDSVLSSGIADFDTLNKMIFAPKCVACHAAFASHASLMASGYVIVGKPEQSPLFLRTASGQMPKSGGPLSDNEVKAIYNWISAGAIVTNAGGPATEVTVPVPTATPIPPGTASPTYAWIQSNVFTPRCAICHRGDSAAGGYDLTNYAGVVGGGRVVAGSLDGSRLFYRINNNSMPLGGPALSDEIKQAIATWIQNGARNDAPGGATPTPTPVPTPTHVPLPPLEPKFSSIMANILAPRCVSCHNANQASNGVNLQDYNNVRRQVTPGNAGDSKLYKVVQDNEMPRNGTPLSFEQKETIRQWIQAGALNN